LDVPHVFGQEKGRGTKEAKSQLPLKQENQRGEQVHSQRVRIFMVKKLLAGYLIAKE
jgi:hypothetical protein